MGDMADYTLECEANAEHTQELEEAKRAAYARYLQKMWRHAENYGMDIQRVEEIMKEQDK